jgi:hypothetical protein
VRRPRKNLALQAIREYSAKGNALVLDPSDTVTYLAAINKRPAQRAPGKREDLELIRPLRTNAQSASRVLSALRRFAAQIRPDLS